MSKAIMFMEKRVDPRISVKIPVQYRPEENETETEKLVEWRKKEKHTQTMDISLGGMSLTLDQPMPVGSIPRFDISLPNHAKRITIYAQVVWTNEIEAGLKFLMIKNEDLEILKGYLDKISIE